MASTRSSIERGSERRSILKKESFIDVHDDLERELAIETPEQWVQRILTTQQLSPLDLCDRFCFGDARKHRHAPLKHVCEVLFELDEPGRDPMSDAMEEFLYQFSFDGGDGEIVVDIKEALRTLDIWKTTGPLSPSKQNQLGSPQSTVSPAKAAILEVKATKLKKVIDTLQQENLRLSQALSSATGSDERRPPSPLRIAVKTPLSDSMVSVNTQRPISPSKPPSSPAVVSRHERQLIDLANRLEYTGVKKLEERIRQDDKANTGFVSLKQLRWLLAHEFGLGNEVSEAQLMTICLGMNFNAQGLVDYNEFIRVLLDILVYESRPRSSSSNSNQRHLNQADEALLIKTREYVQGFSGSRDQIRARLSVLCDKYDLEGNQSLSLTELTRVFQTDLTSFHPVKLAFPLTMSETKRLLLALAEPSGYVNGDFVKYPAVLDALFGVDNGQILSPHSAENEALLARVFAPAFWTSLRSALCPHDQKPTVERKIHAQLVKILMKLDPNQQFGIAQRHFIRVFDQHWNTRDLEVLAYALSQPIGGRTKNEGIIRYDVLMRLVFGAPELRDASTLKRITTVLSRKRTNWQEELMPVAFATGYAKKLSYRQAYDILGGREEPPLLNLTEFLYLVAHTSDDGTHRVDAHKLWTLLQTPATPSSPKRTSDQSFTFLRRCLRVLLNDHGLEKALERLCQHERGLVRTEDLTTELSAQLRVLKLARDETDRVSRDQIEAFLASLSDDSGRLLPLHVLLDAIFDWDGLTTTLRLPDRLVDVKTTLELFDWDQNGAIDADDWAKAWRQLTVRIRSDRQPSFVPLPLHDWGLNVLVRRFPATSSTTRTRSIGAIDYSRLLVFLLDRHQRVAREQLHATVMLFLRQLVERVTHGKSHVTTLHLEKAFEAIDRDGKGYFHIGDLRRFVLDELNKVQDAGKDVQTLLSYASQGPALESVMASLVGDKATNKSRQKVVSLMRFQALMNHGFFQQDRRSPSPRHSRSQSNGYHPSSADDDDDTSSAEDFEGAERGRSQDSPTRGGHITLLRDLEHCMLEIAKGFIDAHGQISPAAVYAHLNATSPNKSPRRPRSQSPARSARPLVSLSASSTTSSRRSSCSTPRPMANTHEPLTASRLKHTLRSLHGIETSTHLIGQFFLRLGSSTKHFLELAVLAQWLAPLSIELQSRVKQIVREILAKSKSGGGHVDLERFIGTLARRLVDVQEDTMEGRQSRVDDLRGIQTVRPGVLLTCLHQLNVSLRKQEMTQLLRHFGLEDQSEIDFAAFVRRVYEVGQQITMRSDR